MTTIKAVVFDCDGVMFNSKNANKAYYNALLDHFELPQMSDNQTTFIHEHTVDEALTYLTRGTNLLEKFQEYRNQLSYDNFIKKMEIEPTLNLLLEKIRPNIKTAVATNRTDSIKKILGYYRLTHMFDFVISSSNVKFPKPHPSMLNKVIKHFDIDPKEAIYIGDSKIDELASNSANIPFVAYKNKTLNSFLHIDSLIFIYKHFLKINTI